MADYTEPCCCFDASQYTGTPDTSPVEHPLDVPAIIKGLDELNNSGREAEAEAYLDQWLEKPAAGKTGGRNSRSSVRFSGRFAVL